MRQMHHGAFFRAWDLETERLERQGQSPWSLNNEIIQAGLVTLGLYGGLIAAFGLALWVAFQAMNMATEKNTIDSHLVDFDRKFDAPREPNTVAEAPAPKPEPACAPAPRCMRISAIMAIATST